MMLEQYEASSADFWPVDCEHEFRTRAGSNAYEKKLICTKCGFKTEEKVKPKFEDTSLCPHENVSHLKSTLKEKRSYCLDCHTLIDQMPRPEYNEAIRVAKTIERSESRIRETAEKLAEDLLMTKEEVQYVVQFFFSRVEALCKEVGDGERW